MSDLRIGNFQILGTLGNGAHSTILHVRRSADSRREALEARRSFAGLEQVRLSRDLEEGFMDDSDDDSLHLQDRR